MTDWLTESGTDRDFTDVTLVSDDTNYFTWLCDLDDLDDPDNHDDHDDHSKSVFSVTKRSRSDESHWVTNWVTY